MGFLVTRISKTGFLLAVLLGVSLLFPNVAGFLHTTTLSSSGKRVNKFESLLAASSSADTVERKLDDKQVEFTLGYLNKHHPDVLRAFAASFSSLGQIMRKKNAWSGGSYEIKGATIVGIDNQEMELEVAVVERESTKTEIVKFDLDSFPVSVTRSPHADMEPIPRDDLKLLPIDDLVRRLNRLCWIVNKPSTTGKLTQMGIQLGGSGVGELKENMFLNQVPHNRYVRQYFYDMAADAVLEAVILCSEGKISNRMQVISMFPEMNPGMDSYRIGTILEMVRQFVFRLVENNLRVRVCVQASMGEGIFTGVPKQLNGVTKLLQLMDWQAQEGEENEGMIGNFLRFGAIGKDHVVDTHTTEDGNKVEQDDVFILIAPQSMVGVDSSIIGPLSEMVDAAGDRPVILLNPDLSDKVSSGGQQNVRGRKERMEFADSFQTIWQFQNIYVSGTSYFPILGSMTKLSPQGPWVAHQRRDLANDGGELYVPVLSSEEKLSGGEVLEAFDK